MKRILIAVLIALPVFGFSYWVLACPCEGIPGLYLRGAEARGPVTDWSFANQVPLCQVQVNGGLLPHALNLNCWANSQGELYLGCAGCDEKRWGKAAVANNEASVRLDQTVYPVTLRRVVDENELDRVWESRSMKAGMVPPTPNPGTARRPAGWWTFHAVSR